MSPRLLVRLVFLLVLLATFGVGAHARAPQRMDCALDGLWDCRP